MPSYLRFGALFCSAFAVDALIQDANGVKSKADKKAAVASLMESAKGMLKNGATTDVVEFATATLDEIADIVIPAIENASATDQVWINTTWLRHQTVKDELALRNRAINQANGAALAAKDSHIECRESSIGGDASEEQKCENKRTCETRLYQLWLNWLRLERELREEHDRIHAHFCAPEANGTLHSFRVIGVRDGPMWVYMEKKAAVDQAEAYYDGNVSTCVEHHNNLDAQSARCNGLQGQLEDVACNLCGLIAESLREFGEDYAEATAEYNRVKAVVEEEEADRHQEFVTLEVVKCLLDRVSELNGRPCDEANGVDTEVTHCEQRHQLSVCSEKPVLCIIYPPVPPEPPNCNDRHTAVFSLDLYPRTTDHGIPEDYLAEGYTGGECKPVTVPCPCSEPWITEQYSLLPARPGQPVPQEQPYNWDNPGCNAYPLCAECPPRSSDALNLD